MPTQGTDDYEEGAEGDGGSSGDEGRNGAGGGEDAELPHFSTLDARDVKTPCVEVTVRAGEMLYLPAGWWHEVTSFSGDAGAHMAFNCESMARPRVREREWLRFAHAHC